jgi:RimJ/RimL family protein N-acetyltransferase
LHGPPPLKVAETARLRLRWFDTGDSLFILRLLNEPSWIRFIGDKGIKSRDDAIRYIENGPVAMYGRMGFGLYAVELKESGELIGMCGLIKREALQDVDLGFAFLPDFWRNGYAFEAASAVMSFGKKVLGLDRIVAILSQDNDRSRKLLEKLGFEPEGTITFQPTDEELHLYAFVWAKQ